jgi:hypothetical protein
LSIAILRAGGGCVVHEGPSLFAPARLATTSVDRVTLASSPSAPVHGFEYLGGGRLPLLTLAGRPPFLTKGADMTRREPTDFDDEFEEQDDEDGEEVDLDTEEFDDVDVDEGDDEAARF